MRRHPFKFYDVIVAVQQNLPRQSYHQVLSHTYRKPTVPTQKTILLRSLPHTRCLYDHRKTKKNRKSSSKPAFTTRTGARTWVYTFQDVTDVFKRKIQREKSASGDSLLTVKYQQSSPESFIPATLPSRLEYFAPSCGECKKPAVEENLVPDVPVVMVRVPLQISELRDTKSISFGSQS